MREIPAIVQKDSITLMYDGQTWVVSRDLHPNFSRIKDALREGNYDVIPDLLDVRKQVEEQLSDGEDESDVTVQNGNVYYKGEPLHGTVTKRIIEMMREGFDVSNMKRFLANLLENPSKRAVDELYDFLEECALPITNDGCFLAYKKVNGNYRDIYSDTFDNSIGAVCEMRRNSVDEDKNRTCSAGLHFCSQEYLPHYGRSDNDRVVLVKINPRDVVAIPADYNNSKGRTCKYEVVDDVTDSVQNVSRYYTPDYGESIPKTGMGDFSPDPNTGMIDAGPGPAYPQTNASDSVERAEDLRDDLDFGLDSVRIKYQTVSTGQVVYYNIIEIRDINETSMLTIDVGGRVRTLRLDNVLEWDV